MKMIGCKLVEKKDGTRRAQVNIRVSRQKRPTAASFSKKGLTAAAQSIFCAAP